MTKEQALQVLAQAVSQMKLTLPEHQTLQDALRVLSEKIKLVPEGGK